VNVLALDLATKTGWALRENGRTESGVETFDVKPHESKGMRFIHFNRWLHDIGARADLIIYEEPINRGHATQAPQKISTGFSTRIEEYCAERGIECSGVYPSTLKKWTTGRGNAKKPEMLEAVERRFGRRVDDDNEADAVALLHYALAEIVPAEAKR
jgi:crossover junction endodeoxyribonuclease RuvC